jgi:lysine-N-methylase
VRRHVAEGKSSVVLAGPSGTICLGEREWTFLAAADGTRDLDGIALAASARGRRITEEHLRSFFGELAAVGWLADGPATPADSAEAPPSRPLVALPGFRLRCDGSGTCCRSYPTTIFTPLEVARARSLEPGVMNGGADAFDAFTPLEGSATPEWEARAVGQIDGRCAFLAPDLRCTLHARGGAGAKPAGCNLYPSRFVDDGETIRVGPVPECRCVFVSDAEEGEPEEPHLPPQAVVERLDDEVELTSASRVDRAGYLAWAARIDAVDDGARLLWDLARELDGEADLALAAERWRAQVARAAARERWRSEADVARRVLEALPGALDELDFELPPGPGERTYVRALAHVHAWALDRVPVAESLRVRALRLLAARRLRTLLVDPLDAAFDQPIALVEAVCRGHGL